MTMLRRGEAMNVTATTQMRTDYTCNVDVRFGKDVVGQMEIWPELLRKAVLRNRRSREEKSESDPLISDIPVILSDNEVGELTDENLEAVAVTIQIVETLKQTEALLGFIVTLATETWIANWPKEKVAQLLGDPEKRERAWLQPTVARLITEAVKGGKAEEIRLFRDELASATAVKTGRKPGPDLEKLKHEFNRTKDALAPVVKRLRSAKQCRNPSLYFRELERENPTLAKRVRAARLKEAWFPRTRPLRYESIGRMTALLMSREDRWGAKSTILKKAKSRTP
jgi:hypothetical protein